jgi:hypothetical protein
VRVAAPDEDGPQLIATAKSHHGAVPCEKAKRRKHKGNGERNGNDDNDDNNNSYFTTKGTKGTKDGNDRGPGYGP